MPANVLRAATLQLEVDPLRRSNPSSAELAEDSDADEPSAPAEVKAATQRKTLFKRRKARRMGATDVAPSHHIESVLLKRSKRGRWQSRYFSTKSHYLLYQREKGCEYLGGVNLSGPEVSITLNDGPGVVDLRIVGLDGDEHAEARGEMRELRSFELKLSRRSSTSKLRLYETLKEMQERVGERDGAGAATVVADLKPLARKAQAAPLFGKKLTLRRRALTQLKTQLYSASLPQLLHCMVPLAKDGDSRHWWEIDFVERSFFKEAICDFICVDNHAEIGDTDVAIQTLWCTIARAAGLEPLSTRIGLLAVAAGLSVICSAADLETVTDIIWVVFPTGGDDGDQLSVAQISKYLHIILAMKVRVARAIQR